MFRFICRNPNPNRNHNNVFRIQESITNSLRLLQTLAKLESNNSNNSKNQDNPTVSYLVNKCGLSLDSAISASKQLTITSTRKPDSVLRFFKSYKFTQTQITYAITKCPRVLVANLHTNLKPKFQYFESLGLSKPDLLLLLFSNKVFLNHSLANTIAPNVDFLKSILRTNENLICALRRWSYIAFRNFRVQLEPNVLTLRAHGTPELNIYKLLMSQPRTFLVSNDLFRDRVGKVEEMGFRPDSLAYLRAVQVMVSSSQVLWEKKIDIFKSFGWSDNDVIVAFKKQSLFMTCSEKKIRILMDFYLNKLSLKASDVVNFPNLLSLSLEKRVMPRCSVLHILLSKGLIRKLNIVSALIMIKEKFDKMFVAKHLQTLPEIVSVYQGEKAYPEFEATQFATMIRASNKLISIRITEQAVF